MPVIAMQLRVRQEGTHKAFVGKMGPRLILCQGIQKGFKINVAWELGCPVKVHFDIEWERAFP